MLLLKRETPTNSQFRLEGEDVVLDVLDVVLDAITTVE
jgi:hypothetical protein